MVSLGGQDKAIMSVFVKIIPCIELLLVLAMLALGGLGYLSLWSKAANLPGQNQYRSAGKWVLPGLIGLAILAILLLFVVSFVKG